MPIQVGRFLTSYIKEMRGMKVKGGTMTIPDYRKAVGFDYDHNVVKVDVCTDIPKGTAPFHTDCATEAGGRK